MVASVPMFVERFLNPTALDITLSLGVKDQISADDQVEHFLDFELVAQEAADAALHLGSVVWGSWVRYG